MLLQWYHPRLLSWENTSFPPLCLLFCTGCISTGIWPSTSRIPTSSPPELVLVWEKSQVDFPLFQFSDMNTHPDLSLAAQPLTLYSTLSTYNLHQIEQDMFALFCFTLGSCWGLALLEMGRALPWDTFLCSHHTEHNWLSEQLWFSASGNTMQPKRFHYSRKLLSLSPLHTFYRRVWKTFLVSAVIRYLRKSCFIDMTKMLRYMYIRLIYRNKKRHWRKCK